MSTDNVREAVVGGAVENVSPNQDSLPALTADNEHQILSTLLFDGIQSYLNYRGAQSPVSRQRFVAAFRWVHDDSTEDVFAFERVCGSLGLEPNAIRLGLANICSSYFNRGKIGEVG